MHKNIGSLLIVALITLLFSISGCGGNGDNSQPARSSVLAAGWDHTVLLKSDGTVWGWGYSSCGQLGNGTYPDTNTMAQINGLSEVTAVAAGTDFTLALKSDSTVYAMGLNVDGQLGDETTTSSNTPIKVKVPSVSSDNKSILVDFTGVTAISAGDRYAVALKNDGTVWAWGKNNNLFIGNTTPVQVTGLSDVIAIAAGGCDTIALKKDGAVWGWGANADGELGDGQTWSLPHTQDKPVRAVGISGVVAIAAGDRSTYALKKDGTVWAWGANWNGQLGDGTTNSSNIPVQVANLSGIVAISAENGSALALKSDGTVWAWGINGFGQLGDGTIVDKSTPVQVAGLSGMVAVAVGNGIPSALKNDGTVWAWGYGLNADGTTNYRVKPEMVNVK